MGDFPQGASKGVGHTTLNWLKNMPFQGRAELTEWLLKPEEGDSIRPRTDTERLAYVSGYATCLEVVSSQGLKKAYEEGKLMVESEEWITKRKNKAARKSIPCGAQDYAYGDRDELIIYGTCELPQGHKGRHQETREGTVWANWSGPADARAPQEDNRVTE